ncbi:hypothetical protein KEM56_007804 [Ascosphaera pollenicola]|nr:hypothetical protein KEM56_007804 [Ascosphaera pollenicola]
MEESQNSRYVSGSSNTSEDETTRAFQFESIKEMERTLQSESERASKEDTTMGNGVIATEKRTVTAAVPTSQHEVGTEIAAKIFEESLVRCGMSHAMMGVRTTTAPEHLRSPRGKQPDASWRLLRAHWQGQPLDGYPQVVVESAYSETQRQLRRDVAFWLGQCNDAVRAVLAVSVSKKRYALTVWTLSRKAGHIVRAGDIVAHRDGDAYQLQQGKTRIVIPFSTIFFRGANMQIGEKDVELLGEDFMRYQHTLIEAQKQPPPGYRQRRAALPPTDYRPSQPSAELKD